MDYQVQRVELEPQDAAVVRAEVPPEGIAAFLGGAFGEVMGLLGSQGASADGPPFARYEAREGGLAIEAGFPFTGDLRPVGRVELTTLPGGPTLLVMHSGAYGGVAGAYEAAQTWMAEHEWEPRAPTWEAYLDGPEVPEPRTVVHVPCAAL